MGLGVGGSREHGTLLERIIFTLSCLLDDDPGQPREAESERIQRGLGMGPCSVFPASIPQSKRVKSTEPEVFNPYRSQVRRGYDAYSMGVSGIPYWGP